MVTQKVVVVVVVVAVGVVVVVVVVVVLLLVVVVLLLVVVVLLLVVVAVVGTTAHTPCGTSAHANHQNPSILCNVIQVRNQQSTNFSCQIRQGPVEVEYFTNISPNPQ